MLEKERRQQENDAAEEVCPRIALLPEEIKIYTLYSLSPRLTKKLKLPVHLLRAVLQAEEPHGTRELAKCTWVRRLHTNEDKSTLFKLAQKASLAGLQSFSAAPNNGAGFKCILDLVPGCRCGCNNTTMSVTFLIEKMNG